MAMSSAMPSIEEVKKECWEVGNHFVDLPTGDYKLWESRSFTGGLYLVHGNEVLGVFSSGAVPTEISRIAQEHCQERP